MTVRHIPEIETEMAVRGGQPIKSKEYTGGDDRIRTCGTLLEYNGLANRRFQPLSHVSEKFADAEISASGKN